MEFSNSELATWRRCRRRWFTQYYLQKGVANEKPFGVRQLGTNVHTALEGYYGHGVDPRTTIRTVYRELLVKLGKQHLDYQEVVKESDFAFRMVDGYVEWLGETGADEGLVFDSAEEVLKVALPEEPGVWLKGKIDARVRRPWDGTRSYIDHKTVGGFEGDSDVLQMDEQFRFYRLLEELDAEERGKVVQIDGGIKNMIKRVKRTVQAKPPFYRRDVIRLNDHDIRSMLFRTRTTVREIIAARRRLDEGDVTDPELLHGLLYPTVIPDRCKWECEFKSVCPMMDDGSDWVGMLEHVYTDVDPYNHHSPSTRWDALKEKGEER